MKQMPDIEKVIEALENADMTDGVIKMSNQFRDIVVELLKEQEDLGAGLMNAVELIHKKNKQIKKLLKDQKSVEPFHKCIGNEFSLIEDSHFDYCPYCGKPITWAKQEGR